MYVCMYACMYMLLCRKHLGPHCSLSVHKGLNARHSHHMMHDCYKKIKRKSIKVIFFLAVAKNVFGGGGKILAKVQRIFDLND